MSILPAAKDLKDWHCHILPGIDDGAADLAEALEIARILSNAGFSEVYCTPHCMRGVFDNTPQGVIRAVAELQAALDATGIPLKLHPGMEYFLDEFFPQQLNEPLPLGDSGCLLVEASSQADPDQIKDYLFSIRRRGFTPLLAHPERYEFLAPQEVREPYGLFSRLKNSFFGSQSATSLNPGQDILGMGCLFQGNLGSFAGIYGSEARKKAETFLGAGSYFCFGSDAHNANILPKILEKGLIATAD